MLLPHHHRLTEGLLLLLLVGGLQRKKRRTAIDASSVGPTKTQPGLLGQAMATLVSNLQCGKELQLEAEPET